jgi:hypothetical protein
MAKICIANHLLLRLQRSKALGLQLIPHSSNGFVSAALSFSSCPIGYTVKSAS